MRKSQISPYSYTSGDVDRHDCLKFKGKICNKVWVIIADKSNIFYFKFPDYVDIKPTKLHRSIVPIDLLLVSPNKHPKQGWRECRIYEYEYKYL